MAEEASAVGGEVADAVEHEVIDVSALERDVLEESTRGLTPATIIPKRDKRGRKRKPARRLTAEDATESNRKIQATMKNVHMQSTLTGYAGYARGIDEWYCINHPSVCDMEAKVIKRKKLLRNIYNPGTIDKEIKIFMHMIKSTEHATLKKADGITPQIKRMGSLNSIRSAFNWYIFTDMGIHRTPVQWHNALTKFYQGLKNQESARKQSGDVPMMEGKSKLKLKLYLRMAEHFIAEDLTSENFTNTWAWNLMCRSMNIKGITASALSWGGDCIAVEYGTTKTVKKNIQIILKHLFANPFQPKVPLVFSATSIFSHLTHFPKFHHVTPGVRSDALIGF